MRGPEGVAAAIDSYLLGTVVAEVDRLADENGPVTADAAGGTPVLDARPRLFAATQLAADEVGIDDWPFVLTVAQRMTRQVRLDVTGDGNVIYERHYPVAVFIWARGDGFTLTARVRDRLTLAVVEALLRDQTFGTTAGDDGAWLRLKEDELRESYSDVGEDDAMKATIAAARVDLVAVATETLTAPRVPLGTADTFDLDTPILPRHPALD